MVLNRSRISRDVSGITALPAAGTVLVLMSGTGLQPALYRSVSAYHPNIKTIFHQERCLTRQQYEKKVL